MSKYRKLRNTRPKAPLGAAISAAASLTAAGIQALATDRAAKEQARAIQDQANRQAESMRLVNENNNRLQEKMIEANRIENEKQNQIFNTMQMNLQMQQGQENEKERLNGARIQLKKGGKVKRLKGNPYSFLQGRLNNLPFQVTDGGGVVYLGTTPSGNDLYELYGNDHKHYHKTKGGKYKSGVGIKFANNQVIEGEGNQNGNQGELMLVGPTDARFISKHSLRGFNPAKAVNQGMTPEEAYIQQERIKSIYNIDDKDDTSTPVKRNKARYGWEPLRPNDPSRPPYYYNTNQNPWFNLHINQLIPTNNRIDTSKLNKILTTGTEVTPTWKDSFKANNPLFTGKRTPSAIYDRSNSTSTSSTKKSTWDNYGGAIIGGIGDLGAAGINAIGNSLARRQIQQANISAANRLADAYRNLKTIDPSIINADSYKAPHAMATIRSANVNVNPELALVDRSTQRRLRDINSNSASGAARLNRLSKAEADAYDMRSQIYSNAHKQAEAIHQENANRLTQTSISNADRDAQSRSQLLQARLNLAQYNNDIANERITGVAQAYADRDVANASAYANSLQANAQGFANSISNIGKNIYDTKNILDKRKFDFNNLMLGASDDNLYNYAMSNNDEYAKQIRDMLINKYKNSKDEKYINWYNNLINIK